MAVTMMKNHDLINPEVMGDMIAAKIDAQLKLTPYAKVDTTLVGVPGDTKTVPSWDFIGSAEDVEEGGEIGTDKLTASSTTFTIKKAMKSVGITQESVNSGLGNPIGQAETQLAKSVAVKVDNDVLDAVYTGTNVHNAAAAIGYAGIVDANAKFADEEDGVDKVMFINPAQEATLLKDSDFLSADKFTAGVAVNGAIGKIAGAWVKKSKKVKLIKFEKNASGTIEIVADSVTETSTKKHIATIQPNCQAVLAVGDKVNDVSSAPYYLCPIIKTEPDSAETEYTEDELPAVTIFLKKDVSIDAEWFPKKQQHDITVSKYYGVAKTNDAKIVLAKFNA
ncbi:N4-gp56 family major capsid protein [Bacillus infantis]|uniref:N4-gp56 family major capsid protein n=1 Tax=Bacillus infantis TaxID=324767 RepID=UPI003CEBB6F5